MNKFNRRPFQLLLTTVCFLLLFGQLLPEKIGSYDVKPVNLLSDVCVSETESQIEEQLADIPEVKEAVVVKKDTVPVPKGMVLIEDYADSTGFGMKHFYEMLRNRDKMDRPVRIAYFGDSFIEGDIYTADLRALLQDKFGGCGIGFTDIAAPNAGFRVSLSTHFGGWDTRHVLMHDSCSWGRLGPTQRYSMPLGGAYSVLKGTKRYKHLDRFETATLYLRSSYPLSVTANMNNDSVLTFKTKGDGSIETVRCNYDMHSIRWNVGGDASVTCFGTALEGKRGITLDNFSFRGSSGLTLAQIPQKHWNELGSVRPYDLIILHFGLNVATKNGLNYSYYKSGLKRTINVLKKAYPYASFLIVGISDREDRINGELHTMPGVKALIKYQQLAASENKIAFWNLYEGMGGEGSIVRMTKSKPKGARLDYTHITREGGREIADIFYNTIIYCYERYIENNK